MKVRSVISIGLWIVQEFRLSMFGLSRSTCNLNRFLFLFKSSATKTGRSYGVMSASSLSLSWSTPPPHPPMAEVGGLMESHLCHHGGPPPSWLADPHLPGMITWRMVGALGRQWEGEHQWGWPQHGDSHKPLLSTARLKNLLCFAWNRFFI